MGKAIQQRDWTVNYVQSISCKYRKMKIWDEKKSLRKKDTTEPEAVKYVEILWTITQWIEHYLCNISMHILHTVLHTFLEMLERRTCFAIKSCFSWWSFPLSLWPSHLIKDGYWYAQVTPSSQRVKLNFLLNYSLCVFPSQVCSLLVKWM